MSQLKLSVIMAQYDRPKYRPALAAVIRTIAGLHGVEPTFVVVDNREQGDWTHDVSDSLVHIGGDNRAHEFSAFDKGIEYLRRAGRATDIYAFATDALLAYGDEYLDLVDDHVVRTVTQLQACVGWMDSFGRECRIGTYRYDTWIRTSLLFVPASRLAALSPLAADLSDLRLFAEGSTRPFAEDADVSHHLQELILEWLTVDGTQREQLSETWHSRFELTEAGLPFFRAKAAAILREHLCSAKLRAAGIPSYDFRAIRALSTAGEITKFLTGGGNPSWQWLGWRSVTAGCPPNGERSESTT